MHVADRGADGRRAVDDRRDLDARRDIGGQAGQFGLDAVDRLDHVGVRLFGDDERDGATAIDPCGERRIGRTFDGLADVADADRCAVAVCDDEVVIGSGLCKLVVVVDGKALLVATQGALRRVDRCLARSRPGRLRA